jgi:hypothetical protein
MSNYHNSGRDIGLGKERVNQNYSFSLSLSLSLNLSLFFIAGHYSYRDRLPMEKDETMAIEITLKRGNSGAIRNTHLSFSLFLSLSLSLSLFLSLYLSFSLFSIKHI